MYIYTLLRSNSNSYQDEYFLTFISFSCYHSIKLIHLCKKYLLNVDYLPGLLGGILW